MDSSVDALVKDVLSQDRNARCEAYMRLLSMTQERVDWAYAVWDDLKADLSSPDNHSRSIAAQLLCNLAKSDPEGRIFQDFAAIMAVTKDKRFVTARHALQSLWNIGLAGEGQKDLLLRGLAERFADAREEKNGTLIRFDIIQGLRNLYGRDGDETIKRKALEWIETEEDPKYRKKVAAVWKEKKRP